MFELRKVFSPPCLPFPLAVVTLLVLLLGVPAKHGQRSSVQEVKVPRRQIRRGGGDRSKAALQFSPERCRLLQQLQYRPPFLGLRVLVLLPFVGVVVVLLRLFPLLRNGLGGLLLIFLLLLVLLLVMVVALLVLLLVMVVALLVLLLVMVVALLVLLLHGVLLLLGVVLLLLGVVLLLVVVVVMMVVVRWSLLLLRLRPPPPALR